MKKPEKSGKELKYMQWLLHPADRTPETKTKGGFAKSINSNYKTLENWDKTPKFSKGLMENMLKETVRSSYEHGQGDSSADRRLILEYLGELNPNNSGSAALLAEIIIKVLGR